MAEEEPVRVPEIRKDTIQNRWVIFSPARSRRPSDFKSKSTANTNPNSLQQEETCPFCIGNEHQCAPEIFRFPQGTNDWKLRVIQNLYPALSRDLQFQSDDHNTQGDDGVVVTGFGFHDVVIESPIHSIHLVDLSPDQVGDVLLAYKKRIHQLHKDPSIQYVQVFKNHGASAGASMSHSHSQIIALPIVPPAVSSRIEGMKEYFEQTRRCKLCQIPENDLIINESVHFISVVPFAASFPFEIWIIPRYHSSYFHELDNEKAVDLGGLLKLMLKKICIQLNDPPFNLMIHTSPSPSPSPASGDMSESCLLRYAHWFLQIVPQLGTIGGFEAGSGCYINPIFPEDAAKLLKAVIQQIPTI